MLHAKHGDAERLTIHHLKDYNQSREFAAEVARGLKRNPKRLAPKFFYDELGSTLFDAICLLPEYYLTRAENEILALSAGEMIEFVAGEENAPLALVEAGSGSATKTRRLIEAILSRQRALHLTMIDISAFALEHSAHVLLDSYPSLCVTAYASDYETALAYLRTAREDNLQPPNARTLALFLGSNIGNFSQTEAEDFLRAMRGVLKKGDALLLGADLKKDVRILEAAYDDALGVTAAFNLNLLARINRELNANFHLRQFKHIAFYNERTSAIEIYIESLQAQTVNIYALDMQIEFAAGERIHTENSHKYALEDVANLAAKSDFYLARTWFDRKEMFSSNLLIAAA
jgi:L-histidine N-alpha-methyltransferase